MDLARIEYLQKAQKYMMQMRPVFQPHALFSDETKNYVCPNGTQTGGDRDDPFRAQERIILTVYF